MERSIGLANRLDELHRLSIFVEETMDSWELMPAMAMTLNLVLEEAFTNIVNYGYDDDQTHEIDLKIAKHADRLVITITDDGVAYDPTLKADPDVSLPAEERAIGGLGIFLIKKMMDDVTYQRIGNTNQLTMVKKLTNNL